MKKIHKSEVVPIPLTQHAAPTSVDTINPTVYQSPQVRAQLLQDQHYTCAYCECPTEGPYGDVEHFRPKASYRQSLGDKHYTPGYYWLAYDWQNLLFACPICNRSFKNDLFPLIDPSQRNIAGRDISQEQPLLLNPAVDDPAEHITYREEIAIPVEHNGTPDPRGRYTIDLFQFNKRPLLLQMRRKVWESYVEAKRRWKLAQTLLQSALPDDVKETARQLLLESEKALQKFRDADSAFSAMFQGLREDDAVDELMEIRKP
jgi:uncharacterized protein (TIGR02646 family)